MTKNQLQARWNELHDERIVLQTKIQDLDQDAPDYNYNFDRLIAKDFDLKLEMTKVKRQLIKLGEAKVGKRHEYNIS